MNYLLVETAKDAQPRTLVHAMRFSGWTGKAEG